MKGRTWRGVESRQLAAVYEMLLKLGGTSDSNLKNQYEAWRVRYAGSVFTAFLTGALYCNGGDAPELEFLYGRISELTGQSLAPPSRRILVGLDETGKGEVLGHAALAAVKVKADVLAVVDRIVGSVDTKARKEFGFWDRLIQEFDGLRGRGVEYHVETIPPWDLDRYNTNKILDVVYQRVLGRVLDGENIAECCVTIDDYGIGANLERYLESLGSAGASIRVEAKADEKYPEVRAASVIAKWKRELAMEGIRRRFSSRERPMGSGNAGDPITKKWLESWKASGKPWPWFVKISFRNIRELDGLVDAVKKSDPPIRHELLSADSATSFKEGRLSTGTLSIVCPTCGSTASAAKLVPAGGEGGLVGRCISCNEVIRELDTTLRYYSGAILPDSSVVMTGALSLDLERMGFFGGFTVLLASVVSKETDQPGGRKELGRLGDFAAMGRIWMSAVSTEVPVDPTTRDEVVIRAAKEYDAILVTRDSGMYGNAIAQHVFTLTFKTSNQN